ncbi:MAG: hypothetical protein HKO65_07425 [Gemmatimonadetes bacterium]|nr:hypothetical protein [Gemmatimonadota bacterium]NNM04919.1 hypothetical protein [Gemmatimonadota bacterium]
MAVLRAEPLGWASSSYRVSSGEEEVTQLAISLFKGKGTFEVDGQAFTIDSHGFTRAHATMKRGSSVIAKVKSTKFFGRRFEISSAGHQLVLEGQGLMGKTYVLRLMNKEVGWIRKYGFAGRKLSLDFPEEVPVFLQVLITYVVISQARREGAAAAAGG